MNGPHDNYGITPGRMGPLRPPVLDDSDAPPVRDYLWIDEPTSDAESARYWAARHGEQLSMIQDLQSDLSAARFQRDGLWPLAFVVGVVVGIGLAVLW